MAVLTNGLFFLSITPDPWLQRLVFFLFGAGLLFYLSRTRRGGEVFMRRIAGLDKIDEAVGRAVEMGRPVFFVPGIGGMSEPATLTAFGLLDRTARLCARYSVRLCVPTLYPEMIPILVNIVREAYRSEGKQEEFNEDDIRFMPGGQFYFAVATMGWMRRERVAASLLFGSFFAEALMLSETAQQLGAVQISGTEQPMQIPFLIATCDYVLIVEEYLAAHAYLVREPVHLSSIRTQDLLKAAMMVLMVFGVISATLYSSKVIGVDVIERFLEVFHKPVEWFRGI
ncbi:MAG: hypothetical protein JW889_07870 [Verrucomicrobia bacterium]|nr:hypothetical protein [Verrucomicrobiota bacterium]